MTRMIKICFMLFMLAVLPSGVVIADHGTCSPGSECEAGSQSFSDDAATAKDRTADEECPDDLRLFYYTNYGEPHMCIRRPYPRGGIDLRGLCASTAADGSCQLPWEGHVFSFKGGPPNGWFATRTADVCPSKGSTYRFKAKQADPFLSRKGGTQFRYVLFGDCID